MKRKRFEATMPPAFSWQSQVVQYPAFGEEGIGYFAGLVDDGKIVHCLLWRDSTGAARGILNYYEQDMPPWEKAGNVNLFVDPDWKRQGIATELWNEACSRWHVTLENQRFTVEGVELARALVRRKRRSRV